MKKVSFLSEREKRKDPQRLIWIAPQTACLNPHSIKIVERRRDSDALLVLAELKRLVVKGDSTGMMFAICNSRGRIEMGMTGTLVDNPILASGVASRLTALVEGWPNHPSIYLPQHQERV